MLLESIAFILGTTLMYATSSDLYIPWEEPYPKTPALLTSAWKELCLWVPL